MEEECRGYSEHILEYSLEDEQRYTAINFLCFYYKKKGEMEKAWEYARKLPPLFYSREFVTPELRDKKFALFSLMFEQGDYGFFNEHLAESHEMQAREYVKRQNKEKCLYHLEQAVESAVRFIGYMNSESFVHTSLLWKQYDSPSRGVSLTERENIATIILSRTEFPEYDSVREDVGFVSLIEKLSGYAGENDY